MVKLNKNERSEQILKAAREEFEHFGYEKAKVSNIATKVGLVEGTIFHRFKSKRGLVIKVMEQFYAQITTDLQAGLENVEGTRKRIHYCIWFHLNTLMQNAALCGVIMTESRKAGQSSLTQDLRQFNRNYTSLLVKTLQEGIDAGDLRKDTSIAIARRAIFGTIEHLMWSYITDASEVDIDASAKELTDFIFYGYGQINGERRKEEEVQALIRKLNELL